MRGVIKTINYIACYFPQEKIFKNILLNAKHVYKHDG